VSAAKPCIVARFFKRFAQLGKLLPHQLQSAIAGIPLFKAECNFSTRTKPHARFFIHPTVMGSNKAAAPCGAAA
ncbi:hypothetical protein, partial [Comamonas antarctica]|uniref:hypothetical protein n=1 Tax=Comamonas antarctica TaxID=2743470 RepID=UPI0028EA0BF2